MLQKIRRYWRIAPLATALLGVSLILLLIFSARFAIHMTRPRPPMDAVIEAWMTPGYVAHSWQVPPELLALTLEMGRQKGKPQTLQQIAEARGVPVETLMAELTTAIESFRAQDRGRK